MPYHRMKLFVGIFLIFFSMLFGGIIYIVLDKKGVFEEKYRFHFYVNSASSFSNGMPLYFSGFQIGMIRKIELTEDGRVHAVFEVSQSNHKWICEDTLLMMEKPLVGSPRIDVMTSLAYPKLEPESVLRIIVRDDINDLIAKLEPIFGEVESIVGNVNTITTYLADENGDLARTVKNIRIVTDRMAENEALLTTLTGKPESAEAIQHSLESLAKMTDEMHRILQNVHENVVEPSGTLVRHLDTILRDVNKKLQVLDGTVRAIGGYDSDLAAMKDEIRLGISKTNQLVEKIDALLIDKAPKEVELP